MDHDYNAIAPDAEPTPEDLRFFREKLTAPDGLTLPASLTAEALFRRLDQGALSLPEDNTNTHPEQTVPAESTSSEPSADETRKVIPWEKTLRRWLPVAACLAVVLLLYQGQQTAMARNFSTATANSPAPSSAAYSLIQETLTEDAPAESEEASTQAPAAPAAPAPEPSPAAPAENGNARKAAGSENLFDKAKEETDSSADTAEDSAPDYLNSGIGGPPTGGNGPAEFSTEDAQDGNPPTGGGNPTESSPADSANDPMTGGGEPDISLRTLAIRAEAEKLAEANAPDGCTYILVILGYSQEIDGERVCFDAIYQTADGQNVGSLTFLCRIREEEKDGRTLWLEVLSCLPPD